MKRSILFSMMVLHSGSISLPAQASFDILIRHGRVIVGAGNPWIYADVGINGDRIAAIGDLSRASATKVLDATGLYVAPGFIDVHSHAGPGLATPGLSGGRPLLAQGVTTVALNPDGGGPVDLARQREELMRDGLGVNVMLLVPHGSVRRAVVGMDNRAPNSEELARMKDLVQAGMAEGAFGLSSGLYYAPGSYARTEEVVELARVAARSGGVYTSHIRDEADYNIGLVAAVDEVIEISRRADLPGIVTHIKALGPRVWGYSLALVKRIDRARAEGLQVWADQYPYEASGTGITGALVPRWAQVGGREALVKRLNDPETRSKIRTEMLDNLDRRGGAGRLQFQRYEPDSSIEGKSVQEVADTRRLEPVDLCLQLLEKDDAGLVSFNMDADDVRTLMVQDWTMTCSDGDLVPLGEGVPHPRAYGTFPRKIRKYVLEDRVIGLAQAIRSMTSLPAQVFRLRDRGVLREGAAADVVVFDLNKIRDPATYENPHQLSQGMVHVLVNGVPAMENGEFTDRLSGRVLRLGTD